MWDPLKERGRLQVSEDLTVANVQNDSSDTFRKNDSLIKKTKTKVLSKAGWKYVLTSFTIGLTVNPILLKDIHRLISPCDNTKTQNRMDRYDGFTLKKKIRDSRTDETPRPHSRVHVCSWHLSSNGKRLVPSLSHRGILSRQDCTPMKTTHPFSCTPVQLHTHPISILSSKVKHNGSIHKYTQLVMLTHYSHLRGWLPFITLGHKHNQTPPHVSNRNDHDRCQSR